MKKSRSLNGLDKGKKHSELIISPFSRSLKEKKLVKDPFARLNRDGSKKLKPVSPSSMRLPSLEGKLTPKNNEKSPMIKLPVQPSLKFEDFFKLNRLKTEKKCVFATPKTPYFKMRRKEGLTNSKQILTARNRNSEANLHEISFGNNN